MTRRTIAVLGLGSIGMRHARNLMELGCDVTGYDPDPQCRQALKDAGGTVARSRMDAIEACDAVIVATPNVQHVDDLAVAIEAHRHAFVEKPLAHSSDGVGNLINAAARQNTLVFAGFMLRYHPVVERLHQLLSERAVGEVYSLRVACGSWLPSWRPQDDYRTGYAADPVSGGVIFDIVHEIDLACHLMGPAVVTACVARRSGLLDIASEDIADLVLTHENGVQSNLHLDYLARPPVREGSIYGSGGTLHYDLNARTFRRLDVDGAERESQVFPGGWSDDYVAEMRDFLDCLEGRTEPRCDGTQAHQVLKTVIAARAMAGLPQ